MGLSSVSTCQGSPARPGRRHAADLRWALAFVIPYAALFLAFAVHPLVHALSMGATRALYSELLADPFYLPTLLNTLLFVAVGVNVTMFLAVLLSGFFARRRRWIRALLVVYLLPWALPAVQTSISFRWMLSGEDGLIDRLLSVWLGVEGPLWFNHRGLALGANIVAYIWKWLPFWTAVFLAGRMAIPDDVSDAATVDGATGGRRFIHVTFPLLAPLYLVGTLLFTLWTLGEFTTVYFVSGGAPVWSTDVLTTLAFRYAFEAARPQLAVAAVLSFVPLLLATVLILGRALERRRVAL